MTCRSTVIGTPRSASSCGAHAPGAMTSAPASYVPAAVVTRTPEAEDSHVQHRLGEPQVGAGPRAEGEVRRDGALGPDEPGLALVERDLVVGQPERGEPPAHLGRVEHLVRQVPLPRGAQAAGDGVRVGPADEQAAGERDEVLAGVDGGPLPQLVRPQQQRHVRRVLEVGLPGDPRAAVAGAERVRRACAARARAPAARGRPGSRRRRCPCRRARSRSRRTARAGS